MNIAIDRSLVGTEWIKVDARHVGQRARVESVSVRGIKLRFLGRPTTSPHASNQMFQRLDWKELGLNWQPNDKRSQQAFDKWSLQIAAESAIRNPDGPAAEEIRGIIQNIVGDPMRVTTDKEGFVLKVQPDVAATEIPSGELMLPCTGGWHRGKGTAYTLVPSSQFSKVDRGLRKGEWMKTCNECRSKAAISQRKMTDARNAAKHALDVGLGDIEMANVTPEPVVTNGVVIREMHQWRVTVVKETVVMVEATDFLDAATKAGEGEVTRVERIG